MWWTDIYRRIISAVKSVKLKKAPRPDGLPVEFYLTFWNNIVNALHESLTESLSCSSKGRLSTSQTRAIIRLIYKIGDRQLLKHWLKAYMFIQHTFIRFL